jgi:hypothetical protein
VQVDGPGEHRLLQVAALADKILYRVAVADLSDVLGDDGALE